MHSPLKSISWEGGAVAPCLRVGPFHVLCGAVGFVLSAVSGSRIFGFFFLEISGMSYSLHVGLDTLLWARGKSVESWQALASG